jgi:hypothetical protein
MLKLWDFECNVCRHVWEALVEPGDDAPMCPHACGGRGVCQPFTQGTAARAETNPAKTREMFQKAAEMKNKVQGRTPWRKTSYSQTGNE